MYLAGSVQRWESTSCTGTPIHGGWVGWVAGSKGGGGGGYRGGGGGGGGLGGAIVEGCVQEWRACACARVSV
jgi:hypothetical protein